MVVCLPCFLVDYRWKEKSKCDGSQVWRGCLRYVEDQLKDYSSHQHKTSLEFVKQGEVASYPPLILLQELKKSLLGWIPQVNFRNMFWVSQFSANLPLYEEHVTLLPCYTYCLRLECTRLHQPFQFNDKKFSQLLSILFSLAPLQILSFSPRCLLESQADFLL